MMDSFWKGRATLVTGAEGFLGSAVVARLRSSGADALFAPPRKEFDLRSYSDAEAMFKRYRSRYVFHLAARVGGIGANIAAPGEFFYENAAINLNVIEAARRAGVEKFTTVGAICQYPADLAPPLKECSLLDGYPEPTNGPYAIAKRLGLVQLQAYRAQYNLRSAYVVLPSLYGPNDNFDLEASHVIPALIRKFSEAAKSKAGKVTLWGTGTPVREFLFVEDAAEALVRAAESYDSNEALNVGSGITVSISALAREISEVVGFKGLIEWDRAKPDGAPHRELDLSCMKGELKFEARTSLREGLCKTVDWFRAEIES